MTGNEKIGLALLGRREHVPSFVRVADRPFGEHSRFERHTVTRGSTEGGAPIGFKRPIEVEALNDAGEVVARYPSYTAAGEAVGVCQSTISDAIRSGFRCRGYRWRKAENNTLHITNEQNTTGMRGMNV